MKKEYDVIVIGGGPAGLSVGALLAASGMKALLVEKMPHLGGRYRSIEFHGARADNGVHILSGIFANMEDARAKRVFRRLGLDIRQKPVKQVIGLVGHGEKEIRFQERGDAAGYFQFIGRALGRQLTEEEIAEIGRVFLLMGQVYAEMRQEHLQVSLDQWLREHSTHPVVFEVQDVVDQLAGMDSREWNVAQHAHTVSQIMQYGGVIPFWYPADGTLCDTIITPLAEAFRRHGGEVVTDATARRVVLEGKRATGAWIVDNHSQTVHEVHAGLIVCAVPIFQAVGFRRMLDDSVFPPDWQESIRSLSRLAHEDLSGFYLMKKPVIPDDFPQWVHLFDGEYGKPAYVGDWLTARFCGGREPKGTQLIYSYVPTLQAVPFGLDTSFDAVKTALGRWETGMEKAFPGFSNLVQHKTFTLQLNCGRYSNALVPIEIDVRCPGLEGLYFAGDSVRSRGTLASDKVFEVAEICADTILGNSG